MPSHDGETVTGDFCLALMFFFIVNINATKLHFQEIQCLLYAGFFSSQYMGLQWGGFFLSLGAINEVDHNNMECVLANWWTLHGSNPSPFFSQIQSLLLYVTW